LIAEENFKEFDGFFEDKNDEVRERLFQEFNSLSVVYQKPSERFLKESVLKQSMASEKKYFPERKRQKKAGPQGEAEAEGEGEGDDGDGDEVVEVAKPAGGDVMDLLDFGGPAPTTNTQQQ